MKIKQDIIYRTGEMVPESGVYECEGCDMLGNTVRRHLKKGDYFPRCSRCSGIDVWRRAKLTFPSFIKFHLFHRN